MGIELFEDVFTVSAYVPDPRIIVRSTTGNHFILFGCEDELNKLRKWRIYTRFVTYDVIAVGQ
jgi:hypothetical protein